MTPGGQKNLVLILARELAEHLATPLFVVGPDGTLLFYNEPAEAMLGVQFNEVGEVPPEVWGARWKPSDPDGKPLPLKELPLTVALTERRPAHGTLGITTDDGIKRTIEATAFPLFAAATEFVGAVAIFWERRS